MIILGIETSCDETSAAIIKAEKTDKKVSILSNVTSSSSSLHAKTGGIIPEMAAREQVKFIIPVIDESLKVLKDPKKEIDAIAVTVGPGLIGSLLVGVETAKVFSLLWKKPIIPINHLFGHIYANWIDDENKKEIEFPSIALVVSGGHTDLVLIKNHGDFKWLGGTRDDAAGEVLDKIGRVLKLPYPGGPHIERMANEIVFDKFNFPKPMINSNDFDFSFSGLKTAALREIQKIGTENLDEEFIKNISFSLQNSIFNVLISKTLKAAKKYNAKSILLGGGVSANSELRKRFELSAGIFVPQKSLSTDNAAMIAACAFFNFKSEPLEKITANPELYFD